MRLVPQALQLGRTGEADILFVHSPEDEAQFVAEGFGTGRTTFMHNDFVILGPAADPARVVTTQLVPTGVIFRIVQLPPSAT